MLAGGLGGMETGGTPVCRSGQFTTNFLAMADINGDGWLEFIKKDECAEQKDGSDNFWVYQVNAKGESRRLDRAMIQIDSNGVETAIPDLTGSYNFRKGVFRFGVGWSSEDNAWLDFEAVPTEKIAPKKFRIGDLVELTGGSKSRIQTIAFDVNAKGQVLASVAYYVSGGQVEPSYQVPVPLASLKIVEDRANLEAQANFLITELNKRHPKEFDQIQKSLSAPSLPTQGEERENLAVNINKVWKTLANLSSKSKAVPDFFGRLVLREIVWRELGFPRALPQIATR